MASIKVLRVVRETTKALAAQLGGEVEIKEKGNTHYSYSFNYKGQSIKIPFTLNPKHGEGNLKDWIRQDMNRFAKKVDDEIAAKKSELIPAKLKSNKRKPHHVY